jgi:hypothetical protein
MTVAAVSREVVVEFNFIGELTAYKDTKYAYNSIYEFKYPELFVLDGLSAVHVDSQLIPKTFWPAL